MGYIELKNLWTDDDEMLHVEMVASNGDQLGKQDFYVYPEQLEEFGNQLTSFPSSIKDAVTFEYGKEENYYCHVVLMAQMLGNTGPSSIKVQFENRLKPPASAFSMFFILADPATINDFGKSLINWSMNTEEILRAEFVV